MQHKKILSARAKLYEKIRAYFRRKGVMEVVTPVLSFAGNTDPAIESFSTVSDKLMYLHTSPEFFMKRLLAEGSGSIYQICNVFREGEVGRFHNPEFSMLEWYRLDYDYRQLMNDVEGLIRSVADHDLDVDRISYLQAFQAAGINPHTADSRLLAASAREHGIDIDSADRLQKNQWLDLLMTHLVEPAFDKEKLTFVYDYPASQASLAKISVAEYPVAERFELYWQGVELANGFSELQDAAEQRKRFESDNLQRKASAQASIPLDEQFLLALEKGLPVCSGVALGLDRLLMVLEGASSLSEVIAFPLSAV